jgi:hypothetical protein
MGGGLKRIRPILRKTSQPSLKTNRGRPWSSSLWLFLPINDELAVPFEGSKARLKSSQHGYRDLGVTTFLKRSYNVALASDAFLAFDDEAFNLR